MAFVFDDQAIVDFHDHEDGWKFSKGNQLGAWLVHGRSLTHLVNVLQLNLCGVKVGYWHALNVLLHAQNAFVVSLLWGWRAGVLFAVHPIAGGLSIYVSCRADLLMTFFALLSTWCLFHGGFAWGIAACVFAGMARAGKSCGLLACVLCWLTALCFWPRT